MRIDIKFLCTQILKIFRMRKNIHLKAGNCCAQFNYNLHRDDCSYSSIMMCSIWRKHPICLIHFIIEKVKVIFFSKTIIWTIIKKFYVVVLCQEIWIGMSSNNLVNRCNHCIYTSSHQYQRVPLDINLFAVPCSILIPLKTSESLLVFCWFQDIWKRNTWH